jgi:hypothetical protein
MTKTKNNKCHYLFVWDLFYWLLDIVCDLQFAICYFRIIWDNGWKLTTDASST